MTSKSQRIINTILAVLVSIGAWVFVVYNYEPMTDVKYTDVPVQCTGEEALAERGLSIAEMSTEGISVTLSQKRIDSGRLSEEDIEVVADVSNCVAGDNNITLTVTGPEDTTVISSDTQTVSVSVGRAKTTEMDIDVIYSEDAEEGTEPIAYDLSQMTAQITCTADRINQVTSVAAILNYEDVTETTKSFTTNLVALDREGNEVPHVVISPDEISLDASAGFTKTVTLAVTVKNDADDNYERTYTAPETIIIKGSQDDIAKISAVNTLEIDISYIYEDTEIPLEYDLPDGVYISSGSLGQVLKVSVTEKPEEEDSEDSTDSESQS